MQGKNFFSKSITLAAGEESDVFAGIFSTVIVLASTATDYTTDIGLKIGKMGFKPIPTGVEFSPEGEPFGNFQLKNTGSVSHTIHVLAALGSIRNYNLQLNGDVSIDTVTIDDTTPLKVDDDAVQALLTTMDAVLDSQKTVLDNIKSVLDDIKTSNDQIVTNTTP